MEWKQLLKDLRLSKVIRSKANYGRKTEEGTKMKIQQLTQYIYEGQKMDRTCWYYSDELYNKLENFTFHPK